MAQLVDKAKEFVADKIAHVKKPEASLTDVSIKHVSRDSATFTGQLAVDNPYDHAIPICEISYSLKSAGRHVTLPYNSLCNYFSFWSNGCMFVREIASGTMPDPGSIAAKETTKLDIPLQVPYDFLMSVMKDVGRDWDVDYEMQVGLTVDLPVVGNLTLPVSKKGELKLPTLSDVF